MKRNDYNLKPELIWYRVLLNLHNKFFIEKWKTRFTLNVRLVFGGCTKLIFGHQVDANEWIT